MWCTVQVVPGQYNCDETLWQSQSLASEYWGLVKARCFSGLNPQLVAIADNMYTPVEVVTQHNAVGEIRQHLIMRMAVVVVCTYLYHGNLGIDGVDEGGPGAGATAMMAGLEQGGLYRRAGSQPVSFTGKAGIGRQQGGEVVIDQLQHKRVLIVWVWFDVAPSFGLITHSTTASPRLIQPPECCAETGACVRSTCW